MAELGGDDYFRDLVDQDGRVRGEMALVAREVTKKGELNIVFEKQGKTLSEQETRDVEARRIRSTLWSRSSQAIRE